MPIKFHSRNFSSYLSIAFINKDFQIIEISDLPPDCKILESSQPAAYAIEVKKDWFKNNGINIGDVVDIEGF